MAIRDYKGPGGKYRAYFKIQGKLFSKVVNTIAEGKKWEAAKKEELERAATQTPSLMCSQAFKEYLADCNARMLKGTVDEKVRHFREFAVFLGRDVPMDMLDEQQARAFIASVQLKAGNKSANRRLRNLKACWNWHRASLPYNVWNAVQPYPEDEFNKYIPEPGHVNAVLQKAVAWEKRILRFLLLTGARSGELFNLRWDDVNFERNTLILWTRKRKGGSRQGRILPLSPQLRVILDELEAERDLNSPYVFINPQTGDQYYRQLPSIKNMLKRLCKAAEVKQFSFHALRHYVALRLMESGKASLLDIQQLLGHQRATTTDVYLKSLSSGIAHLADVIEEAVMPSTENNK